MKLFVVDAFAARRFAGNQAGVALLSPEEDWPRDDFLQALAAELKHSETAYVRALEPGRFQVRYFTPEGEVDLCGHATVAAFTVLREEGLAAPGVYTASTLAGELAIQVEAGAVWMDMADPVEARDFTEAECAQLYAAYGLTPEDRPQGYPVKAVSTGLTDILLPVATPQVLQRAVQDEGEVTRLSKAYQVVGVHMFCPEGTGAYTARCRNFAPLYAIPEESATGTSNGALTYYLYRLGQVTPGQENAFLQGERMGKPSVIRSRLTEEGGRTRVRVGGQAVIVLRCRLEEPYERL